MTAQPLDFIELQVHNDIQTYPEGMLIVRTCTKCKNKVDNDFFYGNQKECKECSKKRAKKWAEENPGKRFEARRRYEDKDHPPVPCEVCSKMFKRNSRSKVCSLKCRLLNNIKKNEETECWEWQGNLGKNGYGKVRWNMNNLTTHRAAYEVFNREIPKNLCVCHTCDNRKCINPEHLWIGSSRENTKDKVKKGRQYCQAGEKSHSANLTWEKVRAIRKLKKEGNTLKTLSEQFDCSISNVSSIINQRSWKEAT
jgi:hypothetical protein